MHAKLMKLKSLRLKKAKQTVFICLFAFLIVISGTAYGYSVVQKDTPRADRMEVTDQAEADPSLRDESSPSAPADESALKDEKASAEPTSSQSTTPPKPAPATQPKTPEVYRPESINITEVRASGDAVCDGTTYKLGLWYAHIFTNGRPGTVSWRIEGQRNGITEVVATGSLQIAENQHAYEFPLNNMYYMTQPISTDTKIRFRVTSPNDISSGWISPSEVLSAESPCAWTNSN